MPENEKTIENGGCSASVGWFVLLLHFGFKCSSPSFCERPAASCDHIFWVMHHDFGDGICERYFLDSGLDIRSCGCKKFSEAMLVSPCVVFFNWLSVQPLVCSECLSPRRLDRGSRLIASHMASDGHF